MKRIAVLLAVTLAIAACGSNRSNDVVKEEDASVSDAGIDSAIIVSDASIDSLADSSSSIDSAVLADATPETDASSDSAMIVLDASMDADDVDPSPSPLCCNGNLDGGLHGQGINGPISATCENYGCGNGDSFPPACGTIDSVTCSAGSVCTITVAANVTYLVGVVGDCFDASE